MPAIFHSKIRKEPRTKRELIWKSYLLFIGILVILWSLLFYVDQGTRYRDYTTPIFNNNSSNVEISITVSNINTHSQTLEYKIDSIYWHPQENIQKGTAFCATILTITEFSLPTRLSLTYTKKPTYIEHSYEFDKNNQKFCTEKSANQDTIYPIIEDASIHPQNKPLISSSMQLNHSQYFYPYDRVVIGTYSEFRGYYLSNNIKTEEIKIPVETYWTILSPGWEISELSSDRYFTNFVDGQIFGPAMYAKLRRPYTYRFMTPILLGSLFVFILLVPLIGDLGSLGQIATGMIFGLWGVRQIIILPDVQWPTILEPIFVSLYISLALSIMFRLIIVPFLSEKPPTPSQAAIAQSQSQTLQHNTNETRSRKFSVPMIITLLGGLIVAIVIKLRRN